MSYVLDGKFAWKSIIWIKVHYNRLFAWNSSAGMAASQFCDMQYRDYSHARRIKWAKNSWSEDRKQN